MEEFKRVKRELIHSGSIVDVYQDYVEIPNGSTAKWDFIKHNGAAAVIPVKENGDIVMVKQWRNAIDQYTLEIPAGGLDTPDEPTRDCAKRELGEETGYRTEDIEFLFTLRTTVAFSNEKIDIYVARNLKEGNQHLDPDEYLNVFESPLEKLIEKIYTGGIIDAKTIAALFAYKNKYSSIL